MHSTLMRVVLSAGLVFLLALPVCAAEPTEEELTFYAAQRHRVEYGKLQDKQKAELKNDYEQFSKVATMIMQKNLLKDDRLYAVAQKIVAFDIWTQRFSQTFNPSEADLKKIYEVQQPKMPARYFLYRYLSKDEKRASDLVKAVTAAKGVAKKIDKFTAVSKATSDDVANRSRGGEIGWVDANNLDKTVLDAITGQSAAAVIKLQIPNVGWQVLLVKEYQAERKATFDEAKQVLQMIARQQALADEIKKQMQ